MTEVHEDYGPSYPYSDHKKGDRIAYRVDGCTAHGEILWVAAASTLPSSGAEYPPHYIVIADGGTFPDSVLFGDVVIDDAKTALAKCPYCPAYHPAGMIEQCPRKTNRHQS